MFSRSATYLTLSATLALLSSGCVTSEHRHSNVNRLIETHSKGFEDAILASSESEGFVRDALETIAVLEGELIEKE